jgi:hypothetical protein
VYPNSALWEAYGLAPIEELIVIIDPLVEAPSGEGEGLYRVRTYTPETVNTRPSLPHPLLCAVFLRLLS